MNALVKYEDEHGRPVQKVATRRWKYPITMIIGGAAAIPATLSFLAAIAGGASISGKLMIVAAISIIWLVIFVIAFCFEGDAKGYF